MMGIMEQPPILSRINRLDNVVRHLEEMRGSSWRSVDGGGSSSTGSPSTYSDGRSSSSPRSLQENYKSSCRPMDDVVSETEHKGTLLHRLSLLEDRVLQLCLQLEKEMEQHNNTGTDDDGKGSKQQHHHTTTPTMKSFKQFVKSCVKSKSKNP